VPTNRGYCGARGRGGNQTKIDEAAMAVQVKFFSSLRGAAGCDGAEVPPGSLADAVRQLERQFAGNANFLKLLGVSNAVLNGENVTFLRGPFTKLKDGDQLALFPPLGGG
jgi:molybdopterin converting factor small subunit